MDATFVFLLQVIEEMDDAIGEFLPLAANEQPLPHDHEVELGTLLSAASLVRCTAMQCNTHAMQWSGAKRLLDYP